MRKKEQSYTEAITEIEDIVNRIENSELNIDELSKDIKRAGELIKLCKSKLHTTEEQINKILEELDD